MTIAKFAPAITTYGESSFSNEVGTWYCPQIRHLIVNGVFKWTILHVLNFRTDNNNSGTSHFDVNVIPIKIFLEPGFID